MLALAVAHLLRRHAQQAGLHLSVRELLAELAGIQETVLLYHDGGKGRPRARRILTDRNPTQQALYELFTLDRYAPNPLTSPNPRLGTTHHQPKSKG